MTKGMAKITNILLQCTRPDREPPQWPYSRGHSEGVVAEANEVPCDL